MSTRSGRNGVPFPDAMLGGLAPDGGLYIPDAIPAIDFRELPLDRYPAFATGALRPWLGDSLQGVALDLLCDDAFDFAVPVVPLHTSSWKNCHVVELFHGPTQSFKDFGARFMARAIAGSLADRDDQIVVLVATSGDTGSAVADGFAGQEGVHVVLLFPKGKVSALQERQLAARRRGVTVLRVAGTFDDCQRLVKEAFSRPVPEGVRLTSANSINVGRLLPQTVYHAWAAAHVESLSVVSVPCGNLGNLTAGVLAVLAGLPLDLFIAAHNANSFFPEYLTGREAAFRPAVRTLSNAMDVGAPSNFERLERLLDRDEMRDLIHGTSFSDDDTMRTMREVYESTGYLADPHTAVGLRGIREYRETTGDDRPAVVLATAHPAKFPETVERAVGVVPEMPPALAELSSLPVDVTDVDVSEEAISDVLRHLARSGF